MSDDVMAEQADPDCVQCGGTGERKFVASEDPELMTRIRRLARQPDLKSVNGRCECTERSSPIGEVAGQGEAT